MSIVEIPFVLVILVIPIALLVPVVLAVLVVHPRGGAFLKAAVAS